MAQKSGKSAAGMTQNKAAEDVMKEVLDAYQNSENPQSLLKIAGKVGMNDLLPPREKITVLLIGNHSAGKSSFVNWYIEETIQRTGIAMETSGFTFVTSGKTRASLKGEATLQLFPHFKGLADNAGVQSCISTEVCTSKHKNFPMITFVDTPGMVDGDMKYGYDIDKSILWLSKMADIILVFFDPMGKGLVKRGLDVIEKIVIEAGTERKKVKLCFSKADTCGTEADRMKVMTQISQSLFQRQALNTTSQDLIPIYLPRENDGAEKCANRIDELCQEMALTITQNIQNNLISFEKDCDKLVAAIDKKLADNKLEEGRKSGAIFSAFWLILGAGVIPFLVLVCILGNFYPEDLKDALHPILFTVVQWLAATSVKVYDAAEATTLLYTALAVFVATALLVWQAKRRLKSGAVTLTSLEKKAFASDKKYLQNLKTEKHEVWWKQFLAGTVGNQTV